MGFILLSLIIGIVSEVLWFIFYHKGRKEFIKYDKEHSNVTVLNEADVVSKLNTATELGICNIMPEVNCVYLSYNKDSYTIHIENGIAYVEYDMSGCEIRVSLIDRLTKRFRFWKSVHKAMSINMVMDTLKDDQHLEQKDYKKMQNYAKVSAVSFFLSLVLLIVGVFLYANSSYDKAISDAKKMEFYNNITYGELIDTYLINAEWIAFNSERDIAVVEVNGTSVEGETICIQFWGDLGMGLSYVDLSLECFEANGISLDPNEAMEYIYWYYYPIQYIEDVSAMDSRNDADILYSPVTTSWLFGQEIYGMEATNFSNGMAIVPHSSEEEDLLYGIDEKGNLLFTLYNYETVYENNNFINGLLYIYNQNTNLVELINDKGKITTAEALDGTEIVRYTDVTYSNKYQYDMFCDGYFIVNKVVSTFQGTTSKSAIFDKDFNMIVDYSAELYPVLNDKYGNSTYEGQMYIKGYIIWDEYKNGDLGCYVLDLHANEINKYTETELQVFFEELIETISIEEYIRYGFVEEKDYHSQTIDLSEVIGLNQYSTIDRVLYINENLFLVIFSENANVFFTITNEKGEFNFDPIRYSSANYFAAGSGSGSQIFATDKYVVTLDTVEKVFENYVIPVITYEITTYDIRGNMINRVNHIHSCGVYPEHFYFSVNDEAIIVANDSEVTYYDFDLNVMCEN